MAPTLIRATLWLGCVVSVPVAAQVGEGATPRGLDESLRVPAPIRLDEPVTGTLPAADGAGEDPQPEARYTFTADADGVVTIAADSFEFDARLTIRDEAGDVVFETGVGGVADNARTRQELERGETLVIAVTSEDGGSGRFRLSVLTGSVPPPTGVEATEITATYYREKGRRRLAAADPEDDATRLQALDLLLKSGNLDAQLFRLESAQATLEEAVELAKALNDRSKLFRARALLGSVLRRSNQPRRALESLEPLLSEIDDPENASFWYLVVEERAAALLALGELDEAEAGFRVMLDRAADRGEPKTSAYAYGYLADVCEARADFVRMRELHERAIAILQEEGTPRDEALALGRWGNAFSRLSNHAEASRCYREALALTEAKVDRANLLGLLGNECDRSARYAEARRCYVEALGLALESGESRLARAAEHGLVNVSLALGDAADARDRLESLLVRDEEVLGDAERARLLAMLAQASEQLEDTESCHDLYARAVLAARAADDRETLAKVLLQQGSLHFREGEWAAARDRFTEVVELCRSERMPITEAIALGNRAETHLSLDDPSAALEDAESSVTRFRELGLDRLTLDPLTVIARIRLDQGDGDAAAAVLAEARTLLDLPDLRELETWELAAVRASHREWGSIAERLAALRVREAGGDEAIRHSALFEGFREAGRWKGRSLLEGIAEHRDQARNEDALRVRRRSRDVRTAFVVVQRKIAEALDAKEPAEVVAALRERAETLRREREQLEEDLRRLSPRDAVIDVPQGTGPHRMQQEVLREGDVLIDYVSSGDDLHAYVLTRDSLELVDLGPFAPIESQRDRFLEGMRDPRRLPGPEDVRRSGAFLFDRLVAPALAAVPDAIASSLRRLLLVPSAELAELPFEAFAIVGDDDPPARRFEDVTFLLDRFEVVYAPSTPILALLSRSESRSGGNRALLLGDPVYPAESPGTPDGRERAPGFLGKIPRIPGTRDEVLDLADRLLQSGDESQRDRLRLLEQERSGVLSASRVELHLGEAASKEPFRENLRDYALIHIAAHGWVDQQKPDRSCLVLSPRDTDSGYLSLPEILELDLDADLAVLSACETAAGKKYDGEGLQSVASGFLLAGARRVVASLWQVSDEASSRTMQQFYETFLAEGASATAALREAKLAVRRGETSAAGSSGSGSVRRDPARGVSGFVPAGPEAAEADFGHPFFWAPFICIGDPR